MIQPEYLGPYIGSNVIAVALIVVAVLRPKIARAIFALIFLAAGAFNAYTALTQPEAYLAYGELTFFPFYRDFIDGVFSSYTAIFVLAIAAGQLIVGILLATASRNILLTLGVIGAIIFLTAIAPLGIGSAFPFSIFAITALVVMALKLRRQQTAAASSAGG